MQNNFQSLSYFLPELLIIFTVLFVVISDLVNDLKKYTYYFLYAYAKSMYISFWDTKNVCNDANE